MAPMAVAQGKSIAVSGAVEPVSVHGTSSALFQAVRNLVENGIAYTAPATTVDIAVGSDGIVVVSDEGPGIPADQRELIFQRFWRGDRRRADSAVSASPSCRALSRPMGEASTSAMRPFMG